MKEIIVDVQYCTDKEYGELIKHLNEKCFDWKDNNELQKDYDELYDDHEELEEEHEELKEDYESLKEAATTLLRNIEDAEQDKDENGNTVRDIQDLKDALNIL